VELVVTFGAIGDAFRCEACLKAARYACAVIPEPRALGVSCNYAVAVEDIAETAVDAVLEVLARNDIRPVRYFCEK
jgi:hypothetical protein